MGEEEGGCFDFPQKSLQDLMCIHSPKLKAQKQPFILSPLAGLPVRGGQLQLREVFSINCEESSTRRVSVTAGRGGCERD